MVIPRSPSPIPLEKRDINTLSPDEMRKLLQRQREQDQASQAVKQEHRIKRERTRARSSTADDYHSDEDDLCFVATKRRRLPVIVDEDGTERIDLT